MWRYKSQSTILVWVLEKIKPADFDFFNTLVYHQYLGKEKYVLSIIYGQFWC